MNVGDRVEARRDGATGMVVAHKGDQPIIHWDVPEEAPYSTEYAADLLVIPANKGVYKSERRGYRSSTGR